MSTVRAEQLADESNPRSDSGGGVMKGRLSAIALCVLALTRSGEAQRPALPDCPMLPRDLEIELALSAAPKHLRDGAAVVVLAAAGYVNAREGANAITCIVSRRGGDLFPVCWDAEGTRTLLQVDLDAAKLRLGGTSNAEIDRQVAQGFKDGRYKVPSRTGVAYMLSPIRYRVDEQGHVTPSAPNPHVMFYAPNLTDADVGGVRGSLLFINKVGPDGMIIVPVGRQERDAIVGESRALIERFEREIGYKRAEK